MILEIGIIRRDGGTQSRAAIDAAVVAEYAEAYRAAVPLPAVVVFHDGEDYWLADGFHRVLGAEGAELEEVDADVRQGTRRDAVLHSVGANEEHGLRRTHADRRRAVETLLRDSEWAGWSDRAIAEACKVDHKTVGKRRAELQVGNSPPAERRTGLDGKGYPATRDAVPEVPARDPWPPRDDTDERPAPTPPVEPAPEVPAVEPAGTGHVRHDLDAYYTPGGLATAITKVAGLRPGCRVLEPSCGDGAFVAAISRVLRGCHVTAVDVNPDADGLGMGYLGSASFVEVVHDFLTWETDERFDVIVGNPPYDQADAFVRKGWELLAPDGRMTLLLRCGFLHAQKRARLWDQHWVEGRYDIRPRPSFTGDGRTDGTDYTAFQWWNAADPHESGHRRVWKSLEWTPREGEEAP